MTVAAAALLIPNLGSLRLRAKLWYASAGGQLTAPRLKCAFGVTSRRWGFVNDILEIASVNRRGDSAQRQGEQESNCVDATTNEPCIHCASDMLIGLPAVNL